MIKESDILKQLKCIIDPDFNKDIVSLGFVKNIRINDGDVSLDIALTTPACPVKSEFQRKAEEVIQRLPGIRQVKVNMTAQTVSAAHSPELNSSTLNKVKAIIAVSSCKGGVGKSTVAVCLAMNLAQRGFKVGLLDTDIYGPSLPTLLNLSQVEIHTNEKKQLIPLDVGRLKVMSFGFLLGDAPAVMRGPMVSRYIQQLLHFTDWGELEYLFIDMPPGTGDMQLTLTQSARLNGAVIVTTRHTLSLVDVARGILMFEKVDVPILGVIENMSYFLCDGCGKKHYIFGGDENNTLTERFGIPLLAELPILPELLGNFNKASQNELIQEAVDKVIRALGKSTIEQKSLPKIQFDEKAITLTWPEGEEVTVNNRDLRMSCRCALCVDELTGRKLFKNKDIRPDIAPLEVTPLGNYAIGVTWNDGHSSGIYPYKNIRELAETKVK